MAKPLSKTEGEIYFKNAAQFIKKHTIQLFKDDSQKVIISFATGVLVNLNDEFMVITANHVVNGLDGDLKIILEEELFRIGNVSKYSILDMACILLDNDMADKIKEYYSFLNIDNIRALPEKNIDNGLIASGYPKSKQKIRRSNSSVEIKPNLVHLDLVMTEVEQFNIYNLQNNEVILLNYSKQFRDIGEDILKSFPEPKGLSGGGLWKVYTNNNFEPKCFLVGIMVEYKKNHQNHIFFANRIEHLLKEIKIEICN